jgi:molecular chaperone GrpE
VTDERIPEGAAPAPSGAPDEAAGPVIRDNRVVDPATGEVRTRDSARAGETPGAGATAKADDGAPAPEPEAEAAFADSSVAVLEAELALARTQADEHRVDLQRLSAEFVNFRKRVERDRAVDYSRGVSDVVDALVPVLDDVDAARRHGDLTGPFAAIAEKLESVLAQRFGVERYGAEGEEFDPAVHEALMHAASAEAEETIVSTVLQPGYRVGDRVLRAARVAVVGPE